MAIFITEGRYTQDAIKGMIANPEDRATSVARLAESVGGKLLAYYVTFGATDFMVIIEAPGVQAEMTALVIAASGGGVTDLTTRVAMTSSEAKAAFEAAGAVSARFKPAGSS